MAVMTMKTEEQGRRLPVMNKVMELWQLYFPGICVAITIGIAASFLSEHYGAPAMLMALLLGLAFNFLSDDARCVPGIEISAKTVLRLGVALLGLRITFGDVLTLGWSVLAMVCCAVLLTIGFGILLARSLGFSKRFGVLTGGSVAICGASAAMAISSVLPASEQSRRDTLFTVICVTTMSTIAMVVYPMIAEWLGMTPQEAGLFLGGTIHDVAQVVGAGYSISGEIGDLSIFIKLLRVAMLVPIVLMIGMAVRRYVTDQDVSAGGVAVPGFLLGFVALFVINSLGLLPEMAVEPLSASSSWLLLTAVAALGVRTSLREIMKVGWLPVLLVVCETLFIATLIIGFISFR